jgi:hypothetical protein
MVLFRQLLRFRSVVLNGSQILFFVYHGDTWVLSA